VRKVYKIMLIIFVTLIILIGLYYIQYPVRINRVSLEMELQYFEEKKDITVQNIKIIDNKILALYTYSDGMGYATFNKGVNGRCLLITTNNSYGNSFLIGFIDTNKDNYKIFAGKNYDNKIKSVEFIAAKEKNFVADISKDNYYILPISDPNGNFSFLDFALYDENGKNIKQEIISKYFSKNPGGYAKSKVELVLFNLWYVVVALVSWRAIYLSCTPNKKNNISM
jgi:hypothetical protein